MRLLVRFFGFLFAAGTVVFLVGVAATAGLIWHFSKDLPDYSQLQDYEPPVMTRVHAADGSLLGEYAKERRLYLPIQAVPKLVINAFLAAEDKNFYEHGGIDYTGMARAGVVYIQNYGSNRRPQGASTITQQVAKNFLLTNEVSFARKIKEALLAMRIERTYSKDKILELYLNEIYLGLGAYGIAAASLVYFDKSVNELTVAEASYLAALPKVPATLHPVRNRDRAIERRNYVIDRLLENGWIKQADADKARKEPLIVTSRSNGAHTFAGEYFAEEVRRDIFERYGEKKLYEGGLSVRTTLDPKIQVMARKTMVAGLVNYDEQQGYRGADQQARYFRRLGREARRDQVAVRHLAMADGGGAGDQRPVGAHRLPAGPRTRRRRQQAARDRPHHARWRAMGEGGPGPRRARRQRGVAGAPARRRDLRRSAVTRTASRSKASTGCARSRKCPARWW